MKDPKPSVPPVPAPRDPSETARFLRAQPPAVIPRRTVEPRDPPGLVAHRVLGHRVITRYLV